MAYYVFILSDFFFIYNFSWFLLFLPVILSSFFLSVQLQMFFLCPYLLILVCPFSSLFITVSLFPLFLLSFSKIFHLHSFLSLFSFSFLLVSFSNFSPFSHIFLLYFLSFFCVFRFLILCECLWLSVSIFVFLFETFNSFLLLLSLLSFYFVAIFHDQFSFSFPLSSLLRSEAHSSTPEKLSIKTYSSRIATLALSPPLSQRPFEFLGLFSI